MINRLSYIFQIILLIKNLIFNNSFNEIKVLKNHIKNDSLIVDIGSNQGLFIKFIEKIIKNKKLNIYSIDASERCIEIQNRKNFKNNINLKLFNLAISETVGLVSFFERKIISNSSLNENHKLTGGLDSVEKKIQSTTLDKFCKDQNIYSIDLLKIDCEGFDYNVLKSSKELLENNRIKMIKIEVLNTEDNFVNIVNLLNLHNLSLIGLTNLNYISGELNFFDAYFQLQK